MLRLPLLIAVSFCLALIGLSGCSDSQPKLTSLKGRTMGTSYSILWPSHIQTSQESLRIKVEALLADINRQMSTYDPNSDLSKFNDASAPISQAVPNDFYTVMNLSQEVYEMTSGYFDVTVGPLVNMWGFGPDKQPTAIPTKDMIKSKQAQVGFSAISLENSHISKSQQRYVDLSAVAKGYGVDKVAALLDEEGFDAYLVEIGGELRAKGVKAEGKSWKVAVEKPSIHERAVQIILPLRDASMATSGDYRNFFEMDGQRLSHSIDPFTGKPTVHTLASVSVVDENCARADALATAMLVMGAEKAKILAREQNISALFIERVGEQFIEFKTPAWNRRFHP